MRTLSHDDVDIYLVTEDFGPFGRAILETDLAQADCETIILNFISGPYDNALRVLAFSTAKGRSRDVYAGENIDRAYDADNSPTDATKRFLDRHLGLERRPAAPSTRQQATEGKRSA